MNNEHYNYMIFVWVCDLCWPSCFNKLYFVAWLPCFNYLYFVCLLVSLNKTLWFNRIFDTKSWTSYCIVSWGPLLWLTFLVSIIRKLNNKYFVSIKNLSLNKLLVTQLKWSLAELLKMVLKLILVKPLLVGKLWILN